MLSEMEPYGEDFVNEMKDFMHILEAEDELERFSDEDTEKLFLALALMTGIRPTQLPDTLRSAIYLMEELQPKLADSFLLSHEGPPDLAKEMFYGALTHLAMLVRFETTVESLTYDLGL